MIIHSFQEFVNILYKNITKIHDLYIFLSLYVYPVYKKTVNKHAIIAFLFTEESVLAMSSYPSIISMTLGLDFSLLDRERSKYLTPPNPMQKATIAPTTSERTASVPKEPLTK